MVERLVWTRELVSRFWDAMAQTRLLELAFGKLAGRYLFKAVAPYLSRDDRLLDFGAGDGDFVRLLVEQGFQAAAFEPSAERRAALSAGMADAPSFLGCVGPEYQGEPFDAVF